MQIDWVTVAAQIANFLILVWLLQRFLYRPITRAMERREERIAERLRDAERMKDEAETEAQAYAEMQAELERRRDGLLAEAREAAEKERRTLEQAARESVDAQRREWQTQLQDQRETLVHDLRRRSAQEFYALARRALGDLADADLEEQMARSFVTQLEALDKATADKLAHETARAGGSVAVRSRFDLSPGARRRITAALHARLGGDVEVAYETNGELACGLALKAGGQTLAWSFDSYLEGLEQAVSAQIPGAAPASGTRTAP